MDDPIVAELQAKLEVVTEALRLSEERSMPGHLALELMHEIRNPLEALGHFNYLTREDADDPTKVRVWADMAEEQMRTLNRIASQTLSFARVSTTLRTIDLVLVAEAAIRIHQRKMDNRKIHLVRDLPQELSATAHAGELLQVLSNLLVNALDALSPDGIVTLRLSKRFGKARLLIADNGCGISETLKEKVFEPYFTTKKDLGTGLGLALTRKIVARHGGSIRMRSRTGPGKSGTAFQISLPL